MAKSSKKDMLDFILEGRTGKNEAADSLIDSLLQETKEKKETKKKTRTPDDLLKEILG